MSMVFLYFSFLIDAEVASSSDEVGFVLQEQRAIQTVVSCFNRMKGINLSNCDTLKADFERLMASELPYCGEKEAELRSQAKEVAHSALVLAISKRFDPSLLISTCFFSFCFIFLDL